MEHRKGCIYLKRPSYKIKIKRPETKIKVRLSSYLAVRDFLLALSVNLYNNRYLILSLLWMAVIFYFSHQNGELSSRASNATELLVKKIPLFSIAMTVIPIRKAAHMFLFFVLAFLLQKTLQTKGLEIKKSCIMAFILAVLFAGMDEFHQLFISGREASIVDVGIDSIGAFLSMSLVYCYLTYLSKKSPFLKWVDEL